MGIFQNFRHPVDKSPGGFLRRTHGTDCRKHGRRSFPVKILQACICPAKKYAAPLQGIKIHFLASSIPQSGADCKTGLYAKNVENLL